MFGETINPVLTVLDIELLQKKQQQHAHGVPLYHRHIHFQLRSTAAPFERGVDIVTHPPPNMDGHGAAVGGAIVDKVENSIDGARRQISGLCTIGLESYHGVTYAQKKFGNEGAFITKCTSTAYARSRMHPVATERIPV